MQLLLLGLLHQLVEEMEESEDPPKIMEAMEIHLEEVVVVQ
jgi:hypothetical protein